MKITSAAVGMVKFMGGAIAKLVLSHKAEKPGTMHWLMILDVSGSMNWALTQLKRDMIGFIADMASDNLVTLLVFSGHDQAKVIIGPIETNAVGKRMLKQEIESIHILSNTVFSEPLELIVPHIKQMLAKDTRHHAILFTDGCPMPSRWNEARETSLSKENAEALRSSGVSLSTIGYGDYYNAEFLSDLVRANGNAGVRRHINEITDFGRVTGEIRAVGTKSVPIEARLQVTSSGKKSGVIIRSTPEIVLVGTEGQLSLQSITDETVTLFIALPPGSFSKDISLKGTVNGKPFNETIRAKDLSKEDEREAMMVGAAWAFEKGNLAEAGELLRQSGNETLATITESAYGQRERLTVGDDLRRILADNGVRQRYSNKKYIGAGTSACVVNLLRILLEEDCSIYIPSGTYQKTTVTMVEEGMRHKKNGKIKVIEIQSNQERYNISMKTSIEVEEQKKPGGPWTNAERFRNFVLIKDGNLHVEELEAHLTKRAYDMCEEWGVIDGSKRHSETVLFKLDLSVLPMIVASWANPKQLGLIELMKEEMVLQVNQTSINAQEKKLRPVSSGSGWTPKKTKLDQAVDYYLAPSFRYELKGFEPKEINYDHIIDHASAQKIAKQTRKRLLHIRCIKRLIFFAMDRVGNKLFDGIVATPVKRSTTGKMEQIVELDSLGYPGLSLRRITWTEAIPVTADEEEQLLPLAA